MEIIAEDGNVIFVVQGREREAGDAFKTPTASCLKMEPAARSCVINYSSAPNDMGRMMTEIWTTVVLYFLIVVLLIGPFLFFDRESSAD